MRDIPRRWRLRRLDLSEKLVEHPDEVVIVRAPEDLRDECPALDEELRRELHTHEHELGLAVRVLDPGGTDVRRTVVQHDVRLPVLELAADEVATLGGGDVGGEGDDVGDGLDGYQIDTWRGPLYLCRLV